ncbi:hypothetical protein DXG03_002230 [Asterophora parasitica]|uniref:F-box domain-containing protein n=1 Tax=Asterophora parasitica TaxID=117018 RepID=A0A9P7KB54_9AGAR|nr:hypothetical protein DXG03_002230 [Asterophora parasitica]
MCRPSHLLHFLKLWLGRSQKCPLLLDISSGLTKVDPLNCMLFMLVCSHLDRWHDVKFRLMTPSAVEALLEVVSGSKGLLLESLDLYVDDIEPSQAKRLGDLVNVSFPNLRRFAFVNRDVVPFAGTLRLHQLTHVHLDCPKTLDQCSALLQKCVQGIEVSMGNIRAATAPLPSSSTLTALPKLKCLSLKSKSSDLCTILLSFICPNLHTLAITPDFKHAGENPDFLETFLAQSGCQLDEFRLHTENWIPEDSFIPYLRVPCLQKVQRLFLRCYNTSDTTIALLTARDVTHSILPRLKSISLATCQSSDGVVFEMIASRRLCPKDDDRQLVQLESFLVYYHRPGFGAALREGKVPAPGRKFFRYHERDVARFKDFIAEGMDVKYDGI